MSPYSFMTITAETYDRRLAARTCANPETDARHAADALTCSRPCTINQLWFARHAVRHATKLDASRG